MFDINVLGKWCLTGCWVCWVWWGKVLCRLVSSSAHLTLSQCPGHQPEAPHTGAHTACHTSTTSQFFTPSLLNFSTDVFTQLLLFLILDFWWFLFFLNVVFGCVDGVSTGSSKLLMLFPSACLTKHRNPSSAFKFAGFCDVAQFLGWILVCNLNLPFASGDYWGEGRGKLKNMF